jgi:hypothetical protein
MAMATQTSQTVQMLQRLLLGAERRRALMRSARRAERQEYAGWQLLQERAQQRR